MTDHTWAREQIAAAVAGGLTADEAARLDAHAAACPDCAAALAAARRLDGGLGALFAGVRPDYRLEERAIGKLRTARKPTVLFTGWVRRAMTAAAALLILGTCGAVIGSLAADGRLPMPGDLHYARTATRLHRETEARTDGKPDDMEFKDTAIQIPGATVQHEVGKGKDADPFGLTYERPGWGEWAAVPPPVVTNGTAPNGSLHGFTLGYSNRDTTFGPLFDSTGRPATFNESTSGGERVLAAKLRDGEKTYFFRPSDFTLGSAPAGTGQPPDGGKLPPAPVPKKDAAPAPKPVPPADYAPVAAPEPARRVVIRSGDIEFEVESFDSALAAVTKLVAGIKGGFVATVSSEKLPNGKVKGSVVVRTPPEFLDGLVLDLRKELGKGGELKGVRIGSTDVTKQYTDLESRLRAARTMETRLLQIIKEGKGEIKQLLEAERELGVWRTRIEESEGELRYYANLAALSTLTITLAEKEIRAAAGVTEAERVQAGVEVEDVDKAYQAVLAAVVEAKGRVSKSEVKQLAAGQFNATLHFEVVPDAAGPLRDRLRQIGRVARLEIDRTQQAEGGPAPKDAKVTRGNTVFQVQLYNVANMQPREAATLQVAVPDVPAAYQALRDAVAKAAGRVLAAQLNETDRLNVVAQFDFEVKRTEEPAVRAALDAAGEVVARQVARAPETDSVTDTKILYRTKLFSTDQIRPRETTTLTIEVADVSQAAKVLAAEVAEAKGRQTGSRSDRDPAGHATARLVFEVPLAAAAGLADRVKALGAVRVQQATRDPQAPVGKYATARLDVTLTDAERIVTGDDGVWTPVRRGLAYSVSFLFTSLRWVVFGLCVVLPWALLGYGGYRLVRWSSRPKPTVPATPTAASPAQP